MFYLDLIGFFFYLLHPCKESSVSSFVETVNFTLFRKVIASRVYIFSGCESCILKEPFVLYVCHTISFFDPPKASALDENVSSALLQFFRS